jgi:hypothetical protein
VVAVGEGGLLVVGLGVVLGVVLVGLGAVFGRVVGLGFGVGVELASV